MEQRQRLFQIEPERSPSSAGSPGPCIDRLDHAAVALEDAVGEADQHDVGHRGRATASRMIRAIAVSSRSGLSAQAAMKAPAVERLMPA